MHNQKGYSGEHVGPEGAPAVGVTGATRGFTSRKRWTEGGATTPENRALQRAERSPEANPDNNGQWSIPFYHL